MSAKFTPPPTYAAVVLYNENAKDAKELLRSVRFNPIWLKWFLDVAQFITDSGGGGGGGIDHEALSNLQGGSALERYHMTAAEHTLVVNYTHNTLNSIQGGSAGEYYHFTNAEHTALTAGFSGTGALVRVTSPTLVTPTLGVAAATSINFGQDPLSYYKARTNWTPANPQISLTVTSATYVNIGDAVMFQCEVTVPANADANPFTITGLPFAAGAQNYALSIRNTGGIVIQGSVLASTSTMGGFQNGVGPVVATNTYLAGVSLRITGTYFK